MRKGSLKRMLEAAESDKIGAHSSASDVNATFDLYDLPSTLGDEEIQRVINTQKPPPIQISSPADVSLLIQESYKSMNLNQSLREQYPHDPTRFVDSEIDLDEKIKIFHSVVLDSTFVAAFTEHQGLKLFADLLQHPNEDICVEVVRVLEELTREGGLDAVEPTIILKASSLGDGLKSLIPRLSSDTEGTLSCLQLISNLFEISQSELVPIFQTTEFIMALVNMIRDSAELPEWVYNRSLASEILLDVIQSFTNVLHLEEALHNSTLETIMSLAKIHPPNDDPLTRELSDNLMDCLIAVLSSSARSRDTMGRMGCVEKFIELTLDSKTQTKALEVIEATVRGSSENCEKLIKVGGLRNIGKTLVESVGNEGSSKTIELILIILNSLIRNTTNTSHARVIGKMIENNFEKTRAVVEIYLANYRRVRSLKVADDLTETDVYLMKCEAGLLLIQQSVVLVIRLFAEPNNVLRQRILNLLNEMRVDIQRFIRSVFEYLAMINDEDSSGDAEALREQLMLFQSQAL